MAKPPLSAFSLGFFALNEAQARFFTGRLFQLRPQTFHTRSSEEQLCSQGHLLSLPRDWTRYGVCLQKPPPPAEQSAGCGAGLLSLCFAAEDGAVRETVQC